ncbi:MAG: 30S ribosomal protein S8 [Kiritimatiellae bacterium]|nr:30S ribosomal protein S8 [Kiritimatiellia bacterium]
MSMTDPIADMLTRIRNAQKARHEEVEIPLSKIKAEMARVMKEFGYISSVAADPAAHTMTLGLRYTKEGEPVIRGLRRYSRPGLRRYTAAADIPMVLGGLGHSIISTSKGVMAGRQARKLNVGGEILCTIW